MADPLVWAKEFKENCRCVTCPFVIDAVDVGVGIIRHCEYTCLKEPEEITKEMEYMEAKE